MKKFKKYYYILVVIFFILTFIFLINKSNVNQTWRPGLQVEKINFVKIAGQILKIDLALSEEEQQKGLSGRDFLKNNEGLLFIFEKPAINYFWMKEMNFPIDIIWINEDLNVIYIEENVKPESYPKTFGPKEYSKYVLEVNALFSQKNNLKVGEKIEFLP